MRIDDSYPRHCEYDFHGGVIVAEDQKKKRKRKGERKDGLIQIVMELPRKPDGSRDRKYFYGKTMDDAKQQKKEFEEQLKRGCKYDPNITVGEWVEIVKKTYRANVNPRYLGNDNVPYDRLVEALGTKRVADIREADLQQELNKLAEMSFSTLAKYQSIIKKVFGKARRNKIIMDDPSEDLIRPEATQGTHRCLEAWEVDMILSHWSNKDARVGIWIMLMLMCGLRRGEMMALRWENVDMSSRRIAVCQVAVKKGNSAKIEDRTKTKAGNRILPIPRALYEALSMTPPEKRKGFVCVSANGKQLTPRAADRGIEQFCVVMTRIANGERTSFQGQRRDLEKEADEDRIIFDIRCHDLRHTYATALHDAGVPPPAAQYFLGHKTLRMTLELYTHFSRESEISSRDKLIAHLDRWVDKRLIETTITTEDLSENDINFDPWM